MITVEEAVEAFLCSRQADFVSTATLKWHKNMLRRLVNYAGGKPLGEMTPRLVSEYVSWVRSEEEKGKIKRETSRDIIRAMKGFFNWAEIEYNLTRNPARQVKAPRSARQPSKALSLSIIQLLIAATDNSPAGLRDRAIVYFFAGYRLSSGRTAWLAIRRFASGYSPSASDRKR